MRVFVICMCEVRSRHRLSLKVDIDFAEVRS